VNEGIKKIADLEWSKIKTNNTYRTPLSILKKFTACNKEWEPENTNILFFDADKVSIAITKMINKRFFGDRKTAIDKSMRELIKFLGLKRSPIFLPVEKKVWSNWCLLFACLPEKDNWTALERKKFHQLLELKSSGNEIDFIHQLQGHKKFWISIKELIEE
jgi:hypothetical protein